MQSDVILSGLKYVQMILSKFRQWTDKKKKPGELLTHTQIFSTRHTDSLSSAHSSESS